MKTAKAKTPAGRRFRLGVERERKLSGWIFISPWILGFLFFFSLPLIRTFMLSFDNLVIEDMNQITRASHPVMHTFENYVYAFVQDVNVIPMLIEALQTTVVATVLVVIFSLLIAILLNQPFRGRAFFRAVMFLPAVLGSGLVAEQVKFFTENKILESLPTSLFNYFSPEIGAVIISVMSSIIAVLMRCAVPIVIYIAGLQGIPDSLYEAARVDGATPWESFWKITLPLILPTMLINIVYTIISTFMSADNALINYIYSLTFENITRRFSYAAALSMMYSLLVLIFVGAAYLLFSRKTKDVR